MTVNVKSAPLVVLVTALMTAKFVKTIGSAMLLMTNRPHVLHAQLGKSLQQITISVLNVSLDGSPRSAVHVNTAHTRGSWKR